MEINWIYWDGGLCPLKKGTKIDICHRDGEKFFNAEVGESVAEDWSHDGSTADIIAYRLTFMIDHSKTIEAMALELDHYREVLRKIHLISTYAYEDEKLRADGARALKRIADYSEKALEGAKK